VYYALGKYYQPKSLLEIGVLYGFSSGSIIKGAEGAITYVRGYDIDQYEANSLKIATENVTSILPEGVTLNYVIQNSQDLTELDRSFDMIHIDGEHTYGGKLHDLNLTLDKCKVVIVDDYIFHDFVKQAVDEFVFENKHKIKDHMCLESFRGTYIIEYKDYA
jgi:predicted O-methyltransferase YrrM